MASRSGAKLNLAQCKRIVANGYRSSCNQFDYQKEEVDARLVELQSKADERFNRFLVISMNKTAEEAAALINEGLTAQDDYEAMPDEYYLCPNGALVIVPPRIMNF